LPGGQIRDRPRPALPARRPSLASLQYYSAWPRPFLRAHRNMDPPLRDNLQCVCAQCKTDQAPEQARIRGLRASALSAQYKPRLLSLPEAKRDRWSLGSPLRHPPASNANRRPCADGNVREYPLGDTSSLTMSGSRTIT
jgi:hypothetical protein